MAADRTSDWADWLSVRRFRWLYPYARRKDAGYLANVLSEYEMVPVARRRLVLGEQFDSVEACYVALRIGNDGDADAEQRLLQRLNQPSPGPAPDPMPWKLWMQTYLQQLFQVEKAVLQLQGFEQLLARAPLLVERFRVVAGPHADFLKRQYDQELSTEKLGELWKLLAPADGSPPPGSAQRDAAEVWLRAKLSALLNDVHWWYAQSQVREELYLGQQLALMGMFLLLATLLLGLHAVVDGSGPLRLVLWVMFFGMLGAFASVMRRMRADAEQHGGGAESSYKELTALAYGKIGIAFGLVFGAVFALVLLLIWQSGLAKELFGAALQPLLPDPAQWPLAACVPGDPCTAVAHAAQAAAAAASAASVPASGTGAASAAASAVVAAAAAAGGTFAQWGKLLLWSFVAGFAERLVPDALDRLTRAATPKQG